MLINAFEISPEMEILPCDSEQAIMMANDPEKHIWIDIQGAPEHELAKILDSIEVVGLSRRLCMESLNRPGYYPLKERSFMVMPIRTISKDFRKIEHVGFLFNRNLLLTIRDMSEAPIQRIVNKNESASWLAEGSIAGLVSAVVIVLSLDSMNYTTELRNEVMELEVKMDADVNSVDINEVSDKRSELLTLDSIISGQVPVVYSIISSDQTTSIFNNTRDYLNCALVNLQSSERSLEWLRERVDVLRSLIELSAQESTNHRLGKLTVLSTIFMPMTFFAGVWGMNFDVMPELHIEHAYPVAIGIMLVTGIGLYVVFRVKGWFN